MTETDTSILWMRAKLWSMPYVFLGNPNISWERKVRIPKKSPLIMKDVKVPARHGGTQKNCWMVFRESPKIIHG